MNDFKEEPDTCLTEKYLSVQYFDKNSTRRLPFCNIIKFSITCKRESLLTCFMDKNIDQHTSSSSGVRIVTRAAEKHATNRIVTQTKSEV